MAGKKLDAALRISGELDASLRKAIEAAADRMDEISDAAQKAGGATAELSNMIKKQGQTLKAAQTQYAAFVLNGEEATAEAQALASGIAELTADLNKNKSALAAAEQAAKGLADGLDDATSGADNAGDRIGEVGDRAKSSSGGFTVLKGAIANLAADGFQRLVSGASEALQSLFSLAEQTREFRQDIASLESAYSTANFTTEQATNTWRDLYAIFGEDDRAVETANNISRMAKSQQQLNDWVTITTGAFGAYQDALAVESLAEAAGETAKTGTVTGTLADALNWSSEAAEMFSKYMGGDVVTAEDAFNVALSKCSNEQERQALITDTLLKLYGDAATEYENNAGSLMDANKAAADAQLAQARLGEIIEPVTTQWTVMKTQLMNAVAPALEVVSGKLQELMQWMQEHPAVVQGVAVALGLLAGAITVITVAVAAYAAVQMLANAALLPVIGIIAAVVAAITAVIFIGYLLISNWDSIKAKAAEVWQNVKNAWAQMKAAVSADVQAIVNAVVTWWGGLVGKAKAIWDSIKSAVVDIWESLKKKASDFAQGVVDKISNAWGNLSGILTAPFDKVKGVIDSVSTKIGNLANKAKNVGGSIVSVLPGFASGGFTNGVSIAGEAGTEAVISFDPRYRADNLRYWAQAGRMLGADTSDYILSGGTTNNSSNVTSIENVNFSPNITINGDAKKQDIIDAIRETYPEFMDLIEEVLADREVGAYA